MKYLGLILVVVVALMAGQVLAGRINEKHSQLEHSRARRALGDKLRDFLEKARIIIREGNSTLGVPVLDPFRSEKMEVELDEDLVKARKPDQLSYNSAGRTIPQRQEIRPPEIFNMIGTAEATDFEVTGLSGYRIDKADIALLSRKISLGLTWPHIFSEGSYKFDAVILKDIKAHGAGDYKVTLNDLSFETTVWLKVSGGVAIKKMETSISLGALELSATGIFDDDDTSKILSEIISDMTPQLFQDYQTELTTYVNNKAADMVNKFLEGKSLSDIIAILG